MPHEKLRPKFTFTEERINQLKQVAPEAFADGKINWETLKEALGEFLEDDSPDAEHFGLFWPGKREARRLAAMPSKGALAPCPGEGLDEETTGNIFIEGENLEVLKLLQKSYAGRIKMIYIDPPYNTGNDFIYEDDFKEPLEEYLRRTGQVDEEGRPWSTNTRADGRFHSKWLSMIYPRLRLARNLLRDDGVIFVSIDDNEVHNLRQLMNEVFGEENFIDSIIWKKRYGGGAKEKYLVSAHEYILMFAKNEISLENIYIPLTDDAIDRYYKLKDNNYSIRGPYRTHPLEAMKSFDTRQNLKFPITTPDGSEIWPKRQWRWGKERFKQALKNNEVEFVQDKDGNWTIHSKQYLKDEEGNIRQSKAFSIIDEIYTQHGTNEIINLLGNAKIFGFPKPSKLVRKLCEIGTSTENGDIVLDFFSGSGTTAHAILDLNSQDRANRKYICVQLPEEIRHDSEAADAGYRTIADIAKERIRRASKKIREENLDKTDLDLGFKVFKLTRSNFREWQDYNGKDPAQLEAQFAEFTTPLVEGWQPEHLQTEIMLQEGFPLDSVVETLSGFAQNKVWRISSAVCAHCLIVCLDEKIAKDTLDRVVLREGDIFICLDAAFTDEEKMRLADRGILKTI